MCVPYQVPTQPTLPAGEDPADPTLVLDDGTAVHFIKANGNEREGVVGVDVYSAAGAPLPATRESHTPTHNKRLLPPIAITASTTNSCVAHTHSAQQCPRTLDCLPMHAHPCVAVGVEGRFTHSLTPANGANHVPFQARCAASTFVSEERHRQSFEALVHRHERSAPGTRGLSATSICCPDSPATWNFVWCGVVHCACAQPCHYRVNRASDSCSRQRHAPLSCDGITRNATRQLPYALGNTCV